GKFNKTCKGTSFSLKKEDINKKIELMKTEIKNNHIIKKYPASILSGEKIELMKRAYNKAEQYDELIKQVKINYMDYDKKIMIVNSEGLNKTDRRTRTRIFVTSIAQKDGEMQTGSESIGAHKGFELYDGKIVDDVAIEASRVAKTMILADKCPSGKMDVVIDNGFGGVIFHEACGHGLEATSVAKGNSVFAGKIGKKVASEIVTAIDDGTLENEWGSSNIDDEGNSTTKNVLIENGILKNYMIDKFNGRRMKMSATGSSRRQSYKYAPTSRMTNTYIANGKSTKEEIIKNTENGLFARKMGGGSVNPMTGEFNFSVMEGYIIKNGKIERPVRGASLIGKGSEVLNRIDMVGNNLKLGQGMCGSISGSIPVNVGQPTIRVKDITVGGVKEAK
ncbi:TldD/PmbA family protein, partial [Clostridiaceae bacterium HSG29]|nr:TldD/PmbA family protein [Clostridiaceae bacterium HSG29]